MKKGDSVQVKGDYNFTWKTGYTYLMFHNNSYIVVRDDCIEVYKYCVLSEYIPTQGEMVHVSKDNNNVDRVFFAMNGVKYVCVEPDIFGIVKYLEWDNCTGPVKVVYND